MQLELLNDTVFLKTNDTATQIYLRVSNDLGEPFDLTSMAKVVVVIGVEQGRLIELPTKLRTGVGELEFGLDNGDLLPSGDLRLEVHIYTPEGEMHNAPSKGYYKLKMQKPIDELGVEVTTYTLDYFLDQVNKATADIPIMIAEGNAVIQQVKASAEGIDEIKANAQTALNSANSANAAALVALDKSNTALSNADTAVTNANAARDSANAAALAANTAKTNADLAAAGANSASDSANAAAGLAMGAYEDAKGWGTSRPWSASETYEINNTVVYDGELFQATQISTGVVPVRGSQSWVLLAAKGAKGADGTGITLKGTLNDPSELPPTGEIGDAYMIAGILYVWGGTSWENAGNIQGPVGPIGPVGPTGPKGEKGDKGDKGDIGATGADGKTAYEVAVINGFVGTQEQWLASLKGEKGEKGDDADLTAVNQEITNLQQTVTQNYQAFTTHAADNTRHTSPEDRANWNAMLRAVTVGGSSENANTPTASTILTNGIANGAPDSGYWYILTFTYGGGGGANPNMGQIAIAYLNNGSRGADTRSRYRFGGEWSAWSPSFYLPTPSTAVLATGWYVNTGEALTYYKDGFGIVHVSGRVRRTDGNSSRRITTLPAGYRPTKAVQSQVVTNIVGSGYADIDTSGNIDVWIEGTTNVSVMIDATFPTTI